MRRNLVSTIGLLAVVSCSGLSCTAEVVESSERVGVGRQSEPLVVKASAIWPSRVIPICFDDPYEIRKKGAYWLPEEAFRSGISAWSAAARVRFLINGDCTPGARGVHVAIRDAAPSTKGLGRELDGVVNGVILPTRYSDLACTNRQFDCMRRDSLRLSGRILGLDWEQNHPSGYGNTGPFGNCPAVGGAGDVGVGPYDSSSIMNPCPSSAIPMKLSEQDVHAVRAIYGGPKESIVGYGENCLYAESNPNAWNGSPDYFLNGTPVRMQVCYWAYFGTGGSTFELDIPNSGIRTANYSVGYPTYQKYLDMPGANRTNGTQLQLWSAPAYLDAQKFSFRKFEIRGGLNQCMKVINASFTNGNHVQLESCGGKPAQKWELTPDAMLKIGGKCLQMGPVGNVTIETCAPIAQQKWAFSDGRIMSASKCLAPQLDGYTNGTRVVGDNCPSSPNNVTNQHWSLHGRISHGGSPEKCMDVLGFNKNPGAPVGIWDCSGSSNQEWAYYP